MTHATRPTEAKGIEHYLGPASHRFFGSGYRRTCPSLRTITVLHRDAITTMSATGSISVPGLWSQKGEDHQRPHLGTTDAIILAGQACEILLASVFSPGILRNAVITKMSIVAGAAPIEDDLASFPVTGTLTTSPVRTSSVADIRLHTMRVQAVIAHPYETSNHAELTAHDPESMLGAKENRLYGGGYAGRIPIIEDVKITGPSTATATAYALFAEGNEPRQTELFAGMEGLLQPSLSMIEAFVVALQLGQVLLYALDDIDRSRSNTLWMRRTVLSTHGPAKSMHTRQAAHVDLRDSRLVEHDGTTWRCADITGTVAHYSITCRVTHLVPQVLSADHDNIKTEG